jgi:hypothetical protein
VLKDGNVIDHGDYNTLMRTSEEFARLIKTHVDEPEPDQDNSKKSKKQKQASGGIEARGNPFVFLFHPFSPSPSFSPSLSLPHYLKNYPFNFFLGERKLMTKEHQEEGGVHRKIYTTYPFFF